MRAASSCFCKSASHSRSSWRPPRRLHLEFGCCLPSCRILVPEGVHYHTNCRWPEWFQKPATPGVDRERNYERPGSKRSTLAKFRRGTCATRRFALVLNGLGRFSCFPLTLTIVRSPSVRSLPGSALLLLPVSNPGMAYPTLSLCFEPPTLDASTPRKREPARRRL